MMGIFYIYVVSIRLTQPYQAILGGVSKSMLALNKSVIKVKESQIKGFKMIFELFRKVATSPKSTPDSMTNSTIVTDVVLGF